MLSENRPLSITWACGASSSTWVPPGHTWLLHLWADSAGQAGSRGKCQRPKREGPPVRAVCCFAQQVMSSHLHLRDLHLHLVGQSEVTGLPYMHDRLRNHMFLAEQAATATPAPSPIRASAMRKKRGWLLSSNQQYEKPD